MLPKLNQVVLNGASRHRLRKGFLLINDNNDPFGVAPRQVAARSGEDVAAGCNQFLAGQTELSGFQVEANSHHPTLLELSTPLLPVYDVATRTQFIRYLAKAIGVLMRQAYLNGCRVVAAGVNPYKSEADGRPPVLCADIHEVEVYDNDEVERIYNLYRQFLPELLAVSANAAVYDDELQSDISLRMRLNPASFLPRYISQVNAEHLDRLERMLRKNYGLVDLRKMDVNPLGGESTALEQKNRPLLQSSASTVELRFIDAQCCLPFIRAQLLLIQAIAIYGRSLARHGNRVFPILDTILDENKAAVIRGGTGALLKPDTSLRNDFWFHSQGGWEEASTSLLEIVDGLLLTALHDLGCSVAELWPIILGAELRRKGLKVFTNYAEYQVFVFYTNGRRAYPRMQEQIEQMLSDPNLDPVTAYNQRTFAAPAKEVELAWQKKLARQRGVILSYEKDKGLILGSDSRQYQFKRYQVEGRVNWKPGAAVTFTPSERDGQRQAHAVRADITARRFGRITRYESGYLYGVITTNEDEQFYFLRADLVAVRAPAIGDEVAFEINDVPGPDRWAKSISRISPVRLLGRIMRFDKEAGPDYFVQTDGAEFPTQAGDLEGCDSPDQGQPVTFELFSSESETRAVRVRPRRERQNDV